MAKDDIEIIAQNKPKYLDYIEKYFLDYFTTIFWTLFLSSSLITRTTVNSLIYAGKSVVYWIANIAQIIGLTLFPLFFAIDGSRSLVMLFLQWRKKDNNEMPRLIRNTLIVANVFNVITIAVGCILLGMVANPYALPIVFMLITLGNVVKAIVSSYQYSHAIRLVQAEMQAVDPSTTQHVELQGKQGKIDNLTKHRFRERRDLVFNLFGIAAVTMLLVGVGIPPVGFAGLFLFALAGLVNLIDAKTNFVLSRGVTYLCTIIANACSSGWDSMKNRFKFRLGKKVEKGYQPVEADQPQPDAGMDVAAIQQAIENRSSTKLVVTTPYPPPEHSTPALIENTEDNVLPAAVVPPPLVTSTVTLGDGESELSIDAGYRPSLRSG
jgi:hypothetical protein